MSGLDIFLFGVFPYICLTSFVVGHIWRWKHDKFGWTARSSEWYERRTLRWASPMFHFGLLGVIVGHFVGLVIPQTWTEALGIHENVYHAFALIGGLAAGLVMLIGLVGLAVRRLKTPAIRLATTPNDKFMFAVLGVVIFLGLSVTVYWQLIEGGYNYRESVSIWFRSIFYFNPQISDIAAAPLLFQLHALSAMFLFLIWPYTRLVHVFSAPVFYLWRPYIVYRTRDAETEPGAALTPRGWEKSELPGQKTSKR
ncbi:MAG: respiratory nitrate reductase subunit gamma [Candidatus Nanopelagicales bacterium]